MGMTYFKRYRMEIDLASSCWGGFQLPPDYQLIPWDDELLETHAEVKYRCFQYELDANVFPSLGARDGCRRLMNDIFSRSGFLPEATWLLQYWPKNARKPDLCGTVQGVCDETTGHGAIQNLGIVPSHRGHGLGGMLLTRSLLGFWQVGLARAYLEVTAQNVGAIRLYQRLGFRKVKTVYKAADVAYA
jgi:ribosomal protein S18 acetylase RimI-like enzyme